MSHGNRTALLKKSRHNLVYVSCAMGYTSRTTQHMYTDSGDIKATQIICSGIKIP